jgi:hypothetical protein
MNWFRVGIYVRYPVMAIFAVLLWPCLLHAEQFDGFHSDEYGFSMKYPASWKKIDKPKGNYYLVFQAPELTENFRNRIHVAAHKPVKDPLQVFLQELRNGIADLQKKAGAGTEKQQVRILDEGEFRCEVPGAYYFFIQAYESKLTIWMDIVIVFYKHQETLVRISCLAPSSTMEQFHELFNTVLVSVRFDVPPPGPPEATTPGPGVAAPPALGQPPSVPPAGPSPGQPQVGPMPTGPPSAPPPTGRRPEALAPTEEPAPPPTAPEARPAEEEARPQPLGPRTSPRGPLRQPERPPTGIVN